ncbi:hypothetical protein PIB30_068395 [Stylosanthes scabra]|uniref:Uncharacterized protein n=1 Tax=Stylosanthes scabra TaxID=79078 RepID=A0ABU6WMM3_9FABA|nr:hypothetical protein [Stylosanthes scabra]
MAELKDVKASRDDVEEHSGRIKIENRVANVEDRVASVEKKSLSKMWIGPGVGINCHILWAPGPAAAIVSFEGPADVDFGAWLATIVFADSVSQFCCCVYGPFDATFLRIGCFGLNLLLEMEGAYCNEQFKNSHERYNTPETIIELTTDKPTSNLNSNNVLVLCLRGIVPVRCMFGFAAAPLQGLEVMALFPTLTTELLRRHRVDVELVRCMARLHAKPLVCKVFWIQVLLPNGSYTMNT